MTKSCNVEIPDGNIVKALYYTFEEMYLYAFLHLTKYPGILLVCNGTRKMDEVLNLYYHAKSIIIRNNILQEKKCKLLRYFDQFAWDIYCCSNDNQSYCYKGNTFVVPDNKCNLLTNLH